jgi:hypothetical protein
MCVCHRSSKGSCGIPRRLSDQTEINEYLLKYDARMPAALWFGRLRPFILHVDPVLPPDF